MGLFSSNTEPIMMVCPICKEVYYTDGKPQKCSKCGKSLYLLVNRKIRGSQWKQMTVEQQQQYITDVINAVNGMNQTVNAEPEFEKFITTTDKFENYEIEEYYGTVSGTDIYLIGGLLGGGMSNQEKLFGAAFKNAKKLMFDKAKQKGANAVVGMTLQYAGCGTTGHMVVIATGTAVKLKLDE